MDSVETETTVTLSYSRARLLDLRFTPSGRLSASMRHRLHNLFRRSSFVRTRLRGCRAGRKLQRPIPVVLAQSHSRSSCRTVHPPDPDDTSRSSLVYPKLLRHAFPTDRMLRAGLLNIRSVSNKTENVFELFTEFRLNVLVLTESWHEDSGSVALKRLRCSGLSVIEQARSIPDQARLDDVRFTNHGGLAVVSKPGTCIAKLDLKFTPTSFELLCCRVSGGHSPFIMAAVYRPGSQHVTDHFFSELSTLFEVLAAFNCPTWITGDFNIHLERPSETSSRKFVQLIDAFNLTQFVRVSTHDCGGLLDLVIGPCDGESHNVDVSEVGLSDHKLVHWAITAARPSSEYMTISRRRWSSFNKDQFVERLEMSELCRSSDLDTLSASAMAERYHKVITGILDDLAPLSTMSVRVRTHRPYYDQDCRRARRNARRLERSYRKMKRTGSTAEAEALNSWRSALQASRRLVRSKGRKYWKDALESVSLDSKMTWRKIDRLLGKADPGSRLPSSFTAENYHQHLDDKITGIRERTADAGPAECTAHSGSILDEFSALSTEDVVAIVRSAPNKQCAADPLPAWLLKEAIDVLAPFLAKLFSTSLKTGEFPSSWKHAAVYPHLKRPGSDPAVMSNYRPVSNLPFLSKALERAVNLQMVRYLASNGLMPRNQSAYRRGHSTETAVLRIYNDIVDAIANGQLALLCSLDLSAAFDTVDHDIIIRRLELSYGIGGKVLAWLRDYLTDRTQSVCWKGQTSSPRQVLSGVPQGSVLGPLLFILYVAEISDIVRSCGLEAHAYADDVQIYSFCLPSDTEGLRARISDCVTRIKKWTDVNRLALNPRKTELLWLATPRRGHLISCAPFLIDGEHVLPSSDVRLLGVHFDASLTFDVHIGNVSRSCYYQLRRIREIRRHLPTSAAILLVRAFIINRVDYCNSILWGLPDYQLNRLQMVLNTSARMIFGVRRGEHISPFLKEKLHWLRIPERVAYKRCILTFRALHDPAFPDYLASLVLRPSSNDRRPQLRSSRDVRLVVPPPSRTAKFGERSFKCGNPILWNALPGHVTRESNLESFARNLKTHFFETSY